MVFSDQTDNLFDSHCHLNSETFDADRDEVVGRSLSEGVEQIIDIGIDVETSHKAVQNAKQYESVYAAVGIDPQVAIPGHDDYDPRYKEHSYCTEEITKIVKLISENAHQVKMIGETGLDFYYNRLAVEKGEQTQAAADESNKAQEVLFRLHLELARQFKLPVSIHSRNAEAHCLKVVKEYPDVTGIFHSYTADLETAKGVLDAGWGLGVNGIITFKNSQDLRDIYKSILGKTSADWSPIDFYKRGVYFETDAPYLAPDGRRGERNEPSFVIGVFHLCQTFR